MMLTASTPPIDIAAYTRPPALVCHHSSAEARPLPYFGEVGTGGQLNEAYLRERTGYRFHFVVLPAAADRSAPSAGLFASEMEDVRRGFDRTFSKLPEVFGVSRQTLYNWLRGETPRDQHHARVRELAAAARTFLSQEFRPTVGQLDRPVRGGKSFLQLIAEGADGAASATDLVRMTERGHRDRSRLDDLLGDRRAATPAERAEFELPSFAEDLKRR
jgi:transcriptional regulator with XRE-family HTH domain